MMRLEGYEPLTVEEMEALIFAIMPERNRTEFEERNDTDFAYEILEPRALPRQRASWTARASAASSASSPPRS